MLAEFSDARASSAARGRRSNHLNTSRVAAACISAVTVVSLAACSSSAGSASPSGSAAGQVANVEAAKAAIAPYTVLPTAFPVSDQLAEQLPAGKKFVYLQCSTPICALVGTFVQQAVKGLGGTLTVVNAGATAQTAQAAASTVASMNPDAVLLGAIDPALFGGGLQKLSDAGTKVVSLQIAKDVKQYGITFNYLGEDLSRRNGKLLADWVIAKKGAQTETVLYTLPALDISAPVQKAFQDEMKANCPSCKVRVVPIDVSTIGTTAPRTVVTDLQAHPDTKAAVFVSLSAAGGLPAALKAAGLSVTTVGFGPTAGNLQDIKDGALTAALNIDFPVSTWTAVDAAARLLEGGRPTASEQAGEVPEQFLEQKDITFDPTRGWSAFPDFAQRFATLWRAS
ncbi:sugar ABC transporter substrate-binding protein [Kitasatospora sp. NPDC057223]|uniref:sugar ABC transporter substrate-binding protein n=1 Tax=Kitasatospora sp. NPDC057223 TaxID=3346055 RepID=UPI0036356903